ncbi:energy transducer TonB [Aridibaculum aurantiacum]|uniref:energy transducer TonB n=1 Tax=Aridibaculum aurantiacum TaxID=2810307 RepID=UPI001A9721DA|nr:energy transducer TonB [Aridibaculum aurantiacum]
MKPEVILQSDLLDIIFYNRNQEYGAYKLRKEYNSRMAKAMLFTLAFVLLLVFLKSVNGKQDPDHQKAVTIPVVDVKIQDVELPEKKIVKHVKPVAPKQIAQVANPSIKIVPDHMADKDVKTQRELEERVIGVVDVDGVDGRDGPPLLPPSDGVEGGTIAKIIEEEAPKEMQPLTIAEEMPEFPGGVAALHKFLLRHLRHPEDLEDGQKVVVRIKFVVDAEGAINQLQVLETGAGLETEVLRVVKKMPRWKPGRQNGRYVPVYFQLPVTFVGQN